MPVVLVIFWILWAIVIVAHIVWHRSWTHVRIIVWMVSLVVIVLYRMGVSEWVLGALLLVLHAFLTVVWFRGPTPYNKA